MKSLETISTADLWAMYRFTNAQKAKYEGYLKSYCEIVVAESAKKVVKYNQRKESLYEELDKRINDLFL